MNNLNDHTQDSRRPDAPREPGALPLEAEQAQGQSPTGFAVQGEGTASASSAGASTPSLEGFRGLLSRVSLSDLIHLECLNRRTSVLEMTTRNLRGRIYIKQGNVIHAQAGSKTGTTAFQRLMKMPGGDFHLMPYTEPPQQTIYDKWEQLIMEAAQALDEAATAAPAPNSLTTEDTAWVLNPCSAHAAPVSRRLELETRKALEPRRPRAAEVLVVRDDDEVLYQWQCPSVPSRLRLLHYLQEKCGTISQILNMGAPALVDLQRSTGRALAHFQTARRVFCRTEYSAPQTSPEVPRG